MADPSTISRGHQPADERYKIIAVISLGLVVFMAIAAVVALWLLRASQTPDTVPAMGLPTHERIESFPVPRLQSRPGVQAEQQRKAEGFLLNEYQWIDRQAGKARIPIDRAMELLLQRGVEVRDK